MRACLACSGGEWPFGSEFPSEGDVQTCFLESLQAQQPLRLADLPPYLIRQGGGRGGSNKLVPGPELTAGSIAGAGQASSANGGQANGGPSQASGRGGDEGAASPGARAPFSPHPPGLGMRPMGVVPAGSDRAPEVGAD